MKKKLLSVFLIALLSVNLVACGDKKESAKSEAASSVKESSEKADTTEKKEDSKKEDSAKEEDSSKKEESTKDSSSNTGQSIKTETSGSDGIKIPSIEMGQPGVASIYSSVSGKYYDVKVSLTNIIRGDAAKKVVDEYNSRAGNLAIRPFQNDLLEYGVGEYTVTLPADFPSDEFRPSKEITSNITGEDGLSVKYNDVNFTCSTFNYDENQPDGLVMKPGSTGKGHFIFSVPKGCTNYLICLGKNDGAQGTFKGSYFKGK